MPQENDKVQHRTGVTVPLGGTVSSACPLEGRRILALEQAATFQGDVIHLEHSPDGVNFSPLVRVERPSHRQLVLDLAGPTSGFVRIRLDQVQANVRTFFITTR